MFSQFLLQIQYSDNKPCFNIMIYIYIVIVPVQTWLWWILFVIVVSCIFMPVNQRGTLISVKSVCPLLSGDLEYQIPFPVFREHSDLSFIRYNFSV